MKYGSAESDRTIMMFEKIYNLKGASAKKEPRELWSKGYVYCDGRVNEQWKAFQHGYAFGRCVYGTLGGNPS
jgi:hypothetical protein